jgi:hypothetical protein
MVVFIGNDEAIGIEFEHRVNEIFVNIKQCLAIIIIF